MMLQDSPGMDFSIKLICPVGTNDFVVADDLGHLEYFSSTGEGKNPFRVKSCKLPLEVDKEDNKWYEYMEKSENCPNFLISSMDMVGDMLVYSTHRKQLCKMRMNKDKAEEMGRVSYLTIPFHKSKIRAISACAQQPLIVTTSDSTLMLWSYIAANNIGSMSLMNI